MVVAQRQEAQMLSSLRPLHTALLIAVSILSMTGCHPAMSTQITPKIEPPAPTLAVPLKFKLHNFEALCYNTIGCNVIYNGRYQEKNAANEVSPKKLKEAWGSVELGIRNFPGPAELTWKSLDGTPHEAKIDIGSIFKNELIWHNVPKADMADFYAGPIAGDPDIYLEVDNRTVNVYMAMFIPTRSEQKPGNKDSDFRKDIILAWSHTY
jgi:hypothetical protein